MALTTRSQQSLFHRIAVIQLVTFSALVLSLASAQGAEPATVAEAQKVVDFLKLKNPPDAKMNEVGPTNMSIRVNGSVREVTKNYLDQLLAMGCKKAGGSTPETITDEYAAVPLEKNGFSIYLSVSKSGTGDELLVSLWNQGNDDAEKLTPPANSKKLYGSKTSTMFVTEAKVPDAAKSADEALKKAGWRAFQKLHTAEFENPEMSMEDYFKKGVKLSTFISVAPAQGNKTTIQFNESMLNNDVVVPNDAEQIEFIEVPDLCVECISKSDLKSLIAYFDKEFPTVGWIRKKDRGMIQEKEALLIFEKGDDWLLANLKKDKEAIKISQRVFPKKFFEDKPAPPPAPKTKTVLNLPVPELPKGSRGVKVSDEGDEIEFTHRDEIADLAKFFEKSLVDEGWTLDKDFHVVTKHAGLIQFRKGDASISIDFINIGLGGGTEVSIDGRNVKWSAK
ncbi:hypothetical protein K2Y11_21465 [bacterium]|nr:hypothetical protein [bacterium]